MNRTGSPAHAHRPTRPAPRPDGQDTRPRAGAGQWFSGFLAGLSLAALAALALWTTVRTAAATPSGAPDPAKLTVAAMMAMTDAQLEALDPLVMNLAVACELPGQSGLDIRRYQRTVDSWAARIGEALRLAEESGRARSEPSYKASPDLWRAGGMAVALAGSSIGIRYTDDLDIVKAEQSFVHGVIDDKQGTCASMPVLYMAIGHRLGWPIKAVVSKDHMWTRWDDGRTKFNLEATSAESDGSTGSFQSNTNQEIADFLGTPQIAIDSGSDFTTLTARQTLGVYLQQRAGVWRALSLIERAQRDLCLAAVCFPENREIAASLITATAEARWRIFTQWERDSLGQMVAHPDPAGEMRLMDEAARRARPPYEQFPDAEAINRINSENARRTNPENR